MNEINITFKRVKEISDDFKSIKSKIDGIERNLGGIAFKAKFGDNIFDKYANEIDSVIKEVNILSNKTSKASNALEETSEIYLKAERKLYTEISGIKLEENKNLWDRLMDIGRGTAEFIKATADTISVFADKFKPGGEYYVYTQLFKLVGVSAISFAYLVSLPANPMGILKIQEMYQLLEKQSENFAYALVGENDKVDEIGAWEIVSAANVQFDLGTVGEVIDVIDNGIDTFESGSEFINDFGEFVQEPSFSGLYDTYQSGKGFVGDAGSLVTSVNELM